MSKHFMRRIERVLATTLVLVALAAVAHGRDVHSSVALVDSLTVLVGLLAASRGRRRRVHDEPPVGLARASKEAIRTALAKHRAAEEARLSVLACLDGAAPGLYLVVEGRS